MRFRIFFITYVVANLSLVVYGGLALVNPAILVDSFLQNVYPLPREAVAAVGYLAALFRLLGFFNLSMGLLGLLLLRLYELEHKRWVMQVVIASSLLAYLGPIVFDNTVGRIGAFEIVEHALFIAMIASAIIMLGRREQEESFVGRNRERRA